MLLGTDVLIDVDLESPSRSLLPGPMPAGRRRSDCQAVARMGAAAPIVRRSKIPSSESATV